MANDVSGEQISERKSVRTLKSWTWGELWLANVVACAAMILLIPDATAATVSQSLQLGSEGLKNVARILISTSIIGYGLAMSRRYGPSVAYRFTKYLLATVFVVFPLGVLSGVVMSGLAPKMPYILHVIVTVVPIMAIALAGAFFYLKGLEEGMEHDEDGEAVSAN